METFVKLIVNEFNSFTIELIYVVSLLLKRGSVNIGKVNKNRVGFDGAEPCFLCNSYKGLFFERETDCYKMIFT